MADAQAIVNAASRLSEAERTLVVEALLETLDPGSSEDPREIAEAWRQEVHRRSAELRDGSAKTIPWSEVHAAGERLFDGGG